MNLTASRPRVFLSSVIEHFDAYRSAARSAVETVGGEATLVNEDFPSKRDSSRNTCLDAVASSDVFVLIIGARGGWRAPSGKLVVEEELEEARSRRLPTLVFIEDVEHDPDADALIKRVSDYVDGYFRVRFRGPEGLTRELSRALQPIIEAAKMPVASSDELPKYFQQFRKIGDQTTLRFVLVPERREEVLDPVRLGSEGFADRVLEIGHSKAIRLFHYQFAKEPPAIDKDTLVIDQPGGSDWRHGIQATRLRLFESGGIVIDSNVTGRRARIDSGTAMEMFRIGIEDIEAALKTDFHFTHALYDEIDRHKRHQRFHWNAALTGIGYRSFERNPQPRQSYAMNISEQDEPAFALPEARLIDRIALGDPLGEIQRATHNWTRK